MTTLTGIIQYKIFAEGTKSESSRPYIVLENGSQILLYKKMIIPLKIQIFLVMKDKKF